MIYFIQAGNDGPIKIGYSDTTAESRLKSLQTGNHQQLKLLRQVNGSRQTEANCHIRFKEDHISGEWYKPSKELIDFINTPILKDVDIDKTMAYQRNIAIECFEIDYLDKLMTSHGGKMNTAAAEAGISTRQLRKLLSKYEIKKVQYK